MSVKRWVLVDPKTHGTYTLSINPNAMDAPIPPRAVKSLVQAVQNTVRMVETPTKPLEWSFSGTVREKDMYDALVTWTGKPGRLHLHDHLGRAFEIQFTHFDVQPVTRRTAPWYHHYTIRALVHRLLPSTIDGPVQP